MRPTPDVAINAKGVKAAIACAHFDPVIKGHCEKRCNAAMRMTNAADARLVNEIQSLQVVNCAAEVPNHLADQRPTRVPAVKRDCIAVMTARWVVTLAKTDCVISESYETLFDQM